MTATQPPPFLSYAELAAFVPFSEQALRIYVHDGVLREGVHYFRVGRRVVFKWEAVAAWIEGRVLGAAEAPPADILPLRRRA